MEDSRRKQTEPINLDTCLHAFTTEEELGEDELYYCSKCKKHCLASKKLDIWRLPPILVSLIATSVKHCLASKKLDIWRLPPILVSLIATSVKHCLA